MIVHQHYDNKERKGNEKKKLKVESNCPLSKKAFYRSLPAHCQLLYNSSFYGPLDRFSKTALLQWKITNKCVTEVHSSCVHVSFIITTAQSITALQLHVYTSPFFVIIHISF